MIHRSHPPRREGRFLLSPLTRRTDDGRVTASLSIRSGHGQGTCDRVYRFEPCFRSHAAGARKLVPPLARAAIAAGADGLIVEAHPDPLNAFSDAAQQLESAKFQRFIDDLAPWIELARRERQAPSPV